MGIYISLIIVKIVFVEYSGDDEAHREIYFYRLINLDFNPYTAKNQRLTLSVEGQDIPLSLTVSSTNYVEDKQLFIVDTKRFELSLKDKFRSVLASLKADDRYSVNPEPYKKYGAL